MRRKSSVYEMGTKKISRSTTIFLMCVREGKLIFISPHNWRDIEKSRTCVSIWGHWDMILVFFLLHLSFPSAAHTFHRSINQVNTHAHLLWIYKHLVCEKLVLVKICKLHWSKMEKGKKHKQTENRNKTKNPYPKMTGHKSCLWASVF